MYLKCCIEYVIHDMTKPTKWVCAQQRLMSSLCAQCGAKDPSFLHASSEDFDQTGRMPRLIWVFTGRTHTLFVLSCRSSCVDWYLSVPREPGRAAKQDLKMSRDMTKQTKLLCAQWRLRLAWASAQSDQSLLPAWRNLVNTYEPRHDKTNKVTVRPSKTQISLGNRPVFAVRMKKVWVLTYPLSAQRRLWSDWADAQADLSLRWAHTHFVGFVMSWLICVDWYLSVPRETGRAAKQDLKMSRDMTKQTEWLCAQRRLRSSWTSAQSDQSSLPAWRNLGSLTTYWAHSEDSDQTGRMPRLIWVFAGHTLILLVLTYRGSNGFVEVWKADYVCWMNPTFSFVFIGIQKWF